MSVSARLNYYRRVSSAYLLPGKSQLTFWHDQAQVNPGAAVGQLGEYYMPFLEKADYVGPYDGDGIPLLNYHGNIGLQYNPIAISQWGLGNFNLFLRCKDPERKRKFGGCGRLAGEASAAELFRCSGMEPHVRLGVSDSIESAVVFRARPGAGNFPAGADGAGNRQVRNISKLPVAAFDSFSKSTEEGGVVFTDERGDIWFEEYIVSPPTHILNGFIWAAWGVYDFFLATGEKSAEQLFARAVNTLRRNLDRYDLGFWSLYEQSGTRLPMVASPFYHQLHVTQLRIMHRLTGDDLFSRCADRWETYARSRAKRTRALCYKSAFKLCYY